MRFVIGNRRRGAQRHEFVRESRENGTRARADRPLALLALGFVVSAFVSGCAGSEGDAARGAYPKPMSAVESLEEAPDWVTRGCRAHWKSERDRRSVICGVGSATSRRNPLGARETAVARARSAIARSIEVTIESLVRLEDGTARSADGDMRSIVHQLSTASLSGCQTESVWRSPRGEVHALVSLEIDQVQQSVRSAPALSPVEREDLAKRAADAFAALDPATGTSDGVNEAGDDTRQGP